MHLYCKAQWLIDAAAAAACRSMASPLCVHRSLSSAVCHFRLQNLIYTLHLSLTRADHHRSPILALSPLWPMSLSCTRGLASPCAIKVLAAVL